MQITTRYNLQVVVFVLLCCFFSFFVCACQHCQHFVIKLKKTYLGIQLFSLKVASHPKCEHFGKEIEGFGGKKALGILRKIELCQKRFKFRMQFCLGVLNNVLHVFFPEACFLFEILRMRKNTFFRGHPPGTFC